MNIAPVPISLVKMLCQQFHGYGSAGKVAVYSWAVLENGWPVAAYAWQPPAPGSAKSVCNEAPFAVLALSRMVAVPKTQRSLKHVSKPLRVQMRRLIDRTRWPVLVTYSDESMGHNGYVYQCSGWTKTTRKRVQIFENEKGERVSRYSNGETNTLGLLPCGFAFIQRWEHWACERGKVLEHVLKNGWQRVPNGRTWRSGNPGFSWQQTKD